jgi:Reverse transcriptase-like
MTEPRKPRKASWRELPPAEMAAHLLATPTIGDGVWTSEPRLPRETRSDFVRRVLLGETPESEPETPEAAAAELAGLKRGYYLLNTDGGNSGDPLGRAAIGALLRTPRLVTVAQISKAIGPATHNVAEYQALIEGLKLARDYGIQRIRVYGAAAAGLDARFTEGISIPTDAMRSQASQAKIPTNAIVAREMTPRATPIHPAQAGTERARRATSDAAMIMRPAPIPEPPSRTQPTSSIARYVSA